MEKINKTENENKIILDDITVYYDDSGIGDIPVIFIHGFPFDKSMWHSQMNFLKTSHRVLAYDIRGFGKSTGGEKDFSMSQFAEDLINFMDGLKIGKAIVCGLSMGGYILLNAVIRYPERFTAIILADTQCIADNTEAKEKRKKAILQIENNGLNEFVEGFIKNIFHSETLDNEKETVEGIRRIMLATSSLTITKTLGALMNRLDMSLVLKDIKIPVLIICGNEDKVTPPSQAEFMNMNIANSDIQIIENAGHLSNLDNENEFNKFIDIFISDVTQSYST